MKYKIGDVSKILGISPDLLRYYEKKGVVSPVKDTNNDYRYYEPWDINYLMDCLWFKPFQFGIEQIARIVSDCTLDDVDALFAEKEEELAAAIERQQLLLERARVYREELTHPAKYLGRCDIQPSPALARYLNRHNFIYDKSDRLQQLTQQWLQYMPFTHRCFEIDKMSLTGQREQESYQWGFSLDMDYVRRFGIRVEEPVACRESRPSIHSVFKSSGKYNFSPRLLDYIVDYAEQNHLEIEGGAYGYLLGSVMDEGALTGFFEVWVPIREQ